MLRPRTKSFRPVMRKEWIHIKRDPRFLIIIIAAPILLLTLFGYALRLQPRNIVMTVLDEDRSFFSMTVKDKLVDEGSFVLIESDKKEALEDF